MLSISILSKEHYPTVRQIYLEGIRTGMATFETQAPDWNVFDQKYLAHSRLVAVREHQIVGWCTLSAVSTRFVYRGVAEISIYIAQARRGQGIGDFLMKALVRSSELAGIWTLQAVIFEENRASFQLHENNGFHLVGRRERIGQLQGVWRDNLLLERRSNVVD